MEYVTELDRLDRMYDRAQQRKHERLDRQKERQQKLLR